MHTSKFIDEDKSTDEGVVPVSSIQHIVRMVSKQKVVQRITSSSSGPTD